MKSLVPSLWTLTPGVLCEMGLRLCFCFLSTASKKRKSLTISAPIPCNTAFPPDHPGLSKLSVPEELSHKDANTRSGNTLPEISDSEDSGSLGSVPSTPSRQSVCSESEGIKQHGTDESAADGSAAHGTDGSAADGTEQPGSEHRSEEEDVSVSSQSEDTHTSDTQAEEEDHEGGAESVSTMGRGEKEDGGERGPEVTSQQTDGSQPPGFLYKVSTLICLWLNTPVLVCGAVTVK